MTDKAEDKRERKIFGPFDQPKILNYLPHRYPFLFVDKIESLSIPIGANGELEHLGTEVVGIKNATINEPYFTGHFPGMPITPGVILVETAAQVASFSVFPWVKTDENMKVLSRFELRLAGVDATRFRKPVLPGDRLVLRTIVTKQRGPIWAFKCTGEIDGQLALESEILASVLLEDKK